MFLAQAIADVFAQASMRTEKAQAHSYRGDREARGDFVRGVLQDIAQQADLAQIRSETRNGAGHQGAHFAACIALFGIVGSRGESGAESFLRRGSRFFE